MTIFSGDSYADIMDAITSLGTRLVKQEQTVHKMQGTVSMIERNSPFNGPVVEGPAKTAQEAHERLGIPWSRLDQFADVLTNDVKRANLNLLLDEGYGGSSINHFAAQILFELFEDQMIQRLYKQSPPG